MAPLSTNVERCTRHDTIDQIAFERLGNDALALLIMQWISLFFLMRLTIHHVLRKSSYDAPIRTSKSAKYRGIDMVELWKHTFI